MNSIPLALDAQMFLRLLIAVVRTHGMVSLDAATQNPSATIKRSW
ncbi:MAG: hypothetical protein ABIL11_04350 [Chloroflexota bacterium]